MKKIKKYNDFILEIFAATPPPPPPTEIHAPYEAPTSNQTEDTYVFGSHKQVEDWDFFQKYSYDELEIIYQNQDNLTSFKDSGIKLVKGEAKDVSNCEKLAEQEASIKCKGSYEVLASKKFENSETSQYAYFMLVIKSK